MEQVLQFPTNQQMSHVQAAAYCGIRPATLYNRNYIGAGPRHFIRFGKLWYQKVDLDAWLKSQQEVREANS